MAELTPKTPCDGLLPITHGEMTLEEVEPRAMWSIAPFSGGLDGVIKILSEDQGVTLPNSGESVVNKDVRLLWFGRGEYMMIAAQLSEKINEYASVTAQSDGWAVVRLAGPVASDVLARLVPVDLRGKAFGVDQCCRTLLGHMNVSILRLSENTFEIMAFRSMAQTLVQELAHAMAQVATRAGK